MRKVIVFVVTLTSLFVQAQTNPTWNISAGGSFPIGAFASFSYDPNTLATNCGLMNGNTNGGAASIGVNLGVEALFPIHNKELSFTLSADINYNGTNSDCKGYLNLLASRNDNALRVQLQNDGGTSITSSCVVNGTPSYFNIPLLAGFRYTLPMNNGLDFFIEGGVGANLRFITSIKFLERMNYRYGGNYYDIIIDDQYKYETKGSLAFRWGVGIRFAEELSFGAYYYLLGAGDVFATETAKHPTNSSIQPIEQNLQLGTVNPMMVVVKFIYSI